MEAYLLIFSALILASIALVPLSTRIGAPLLLVFLLLGVLVGEDGPGRVHFDDFDVARNLGATALAIILFSGGLDTSRREISAAWAPALTLATLGVILTATVCGLAAMVVLGLPLADGLLLGAVVGSTDAAATFLLLRQTGVRLRGRIRETLQVEAGLNDPMAIFLTLALVTVVDAGAVFDWRVLIGLAPDLARQLGVGAIAGLAGGVAVSALVNRVTVPAGLYAPFALAGAMCLFAAVELIDGSGYLAAYLCGVVVSARAKRAADRIAAFQDGLAWLAQIVMFVMLGLLITPSALGETFLPAVFIAVVLIFVARPAAVACCLTPFRYPVRDQAYIGWVGLRGAVPIFLAIIPVISPGPITVAFFNQVFVIVVASLFLQGWTIPAAARLIGVTAASGSEPPPPTGHSASSTSAT